MPSTKSTVPILILAAACIGIALMVLSGARGAGAWSLAMFIGLVIVTIVALAVWVILSVLRRRRPPEPGKTDR